MSGRKTVLEMVEEHVRNHEDLKAVTNMIIKAREKQRKPTFNCPNCSEWFVNRKKMDGCPEIGNSTQSKFL